jgi:hypothetical protein
VQAVDAAAHVDSLAELASAWRRRS